MCSDRRRGVLEQCTVIECGVSVMSLSESPWTAECDDELRLCLDRSSDSDHSQLAISELIDSITCEEDGVGDDIVVAEVMDRLLDRVEEDVKNSRHEKRAVRRKRAEERKKSRRRSTSCSTTSSACSDVSRKHRRKHKHHRRKYDDNSPRVNPIFVWVKQDDTRIVEVLCEDYDKRNRIRLTKTAHGWRATPRTERLDSTRSKSSLDLSPDLPTTPPPVHQQPAQTKEIKTKRCVSSKKYRPKRCDRKKDNSFNENSCVVEYNNVDVVNNNNSCVSNNNNVNVENRFRPTLESSLSESRLRSYGYKKACHERLGSADSKINKRDNNNMFEDVDVYTFVPTPKTDYEDSCQDQEEFSSNQVVCNIKAKQSPHADTDLSKTVADPILAPINSDPVTVRNNCIENKSDNVKTQNIEETAKAGVEEGVKNSPILDENDVSDISDENNISQVHSSESQISSTEKVEQDQCKQINENLINGVEDSQSVVSSRMETIEDQCQLQESQIDECEKQQLPDSQLDSHKETTLQEEPKGPKKAEIQIESLHEQNSNEKSQDPQNPSAITQPYHNTKLSEYNFNESNNCTIDSSTSDHESVTKLNQSKIINANQKNEEEIEDEEEALHGVILPEPHLLTPEASPQHVPEPSTTEQEIILPEISLQPDTSLDSDTIHLPDTTTKSETPLLINRDISLSETSPLKHHSEINLESSLLPESLHITSKSIHQNNIDQHSQSEVKSQELIQQAEMERQITADLDEDHLLAIEEILQGKECVEDFDDLHIETYPENHETPVNLVIDLKSKDQVDNMGIPLSLRTDDFLEWPSPMKDNSDTSPSLAKTVKKQDPIDNQIPHAHQQNKTKFLQSILSCPKSFHKNTSHPSDCSDQQEPLYLGVSRKSASPTVSSSDGRKFSSPDLEPKPKRMKVEDITLKTILNKTRESYPKTKVTKSKDTEETQQTADSTTKSRLLELLTNESEDHINKLDPLTQLKEVLSDPDLNVPDPLLVPRARLPALVANPGKEIPRLIAMKTENLYPKLLTDPDLLVVSLSHLQSLLQVAGKEEEMMKYQQHAQLLQQQMKQEQATLDAATATAINQMMWLPYLSQLEAAAVACSNSQDFMAMLNSVYPQMNPYLMTPSSPGVNAYDYKSQLEFQQAFALWNEAMMQAATNQFAAQTLGVAGNNNNMSKMCTENKLNPKQSHSNSSAKHHQDVKHASARTSPITLNYQQSKYRTSQLPYQSMYSVPTSTPATSTVRTTSSAQSYKAGPTQRSYNYGSFSGLVPKTESKPTNRSVYLPPPRPKPPPDLKGLSHHLPSSTTMIPCTTGSKLDPPKLKVKQSQHLVDPHSRPRLLNVMEEHGEVGSTTGSHPTDDAHHNLWHPLFSSHQQKSYSSPWQWTTPVTVAGE